jgi:hypothetical protein
MSLVCPQEDIRISGSAKVCVSCPDGDDPQLDLEGYSRFDHAIYGHFTGPKRVEAVIFFQGCSGEQNPGFTALFRKERGHWHKVWARGYPQLDLCKHYANNGGTDLFICQDGSRFRGFVSHRQVVYRFTEKDVPEVQELYNFIDTQYCCGDPTTAMDEKIEFVELDGDGKKDLRVTILAWQGKGHRDSQNQCVTPFPGGARTYILKYLFRVGRFELTPDSAAAKSELDKIVAADTQCAI